MRGRETKPSKKARDASPKEARVAAPKKALAAPTRRPRAVSKSAAGDVPRYPFVAVDVREAYAGEIAALLFEQGASGVEERDDATLRRGPGHGVVTVVGSFASHAAAR